MARILLHTLVFPPDGVSTSTILSELMQDLQNLGHEITVLTTLPHYNRDLDAEARQPLKPRLGGVYSISEHHGMKVIHTWMPRKGQGTSGRMRDYLIFHALSLILGMFMVGRCDVVLAPSPPLSIGVIGWMLARLKGGKFVYNIQELYPALALQMGLTTPESSMYKLMAAMERFVYARADRLAVISEGFRQHVVDLGFTPEKVYVIPNFVDTDFIQPQSRQNALSDELGLSGKFVVQYAGNIGMTQSFDTLLQVAEKLRAQPHIHFLIVGDGARRYDLETRIQTQGLINLTLLPYQPRSRVPEIYASASLSLVPLMRGTAKTTIPSKLFTIMASGRPALVAVDEDSELVTIIHQAQCGLAIPPDDPQALETALLDASQHPERMEALGANGRAFVEAHFSRSAISALYDAMITELIATKGRPS